MNKTPAEKKHRFKTSQPLKNKIKDKKIIIRLLALTVSIVVLSYLLILILTGKKLITSILNNQPEKLTPSFQTWQKLTNWSPLKKINQLLPEFIGLNQPKTYFVLLQNNWELRPSGGFMGSFAKLKFNQGGLAEIKVQDIYVPDGQLKGHIEPPGPIQQAFQQGTWKLRDSNWEPDFPTAAKQIQWFFDKGGEEKSDGLIALNLLVVKDWLKIIGPITLPDYQQTLDADSFIEAIQSEVQTDFFPGSTQKKDLLTQAAKILMERLRKLNLLQSIKLIYYTQKHLSQKQILLYFNNLQINQFINSLNFAGAVKRNFSDQPNLVTDYFYLVESNLGSNKANCCIERQVEQEIKLVNDKLIEKLTISFYNNSPWEKPNPPDFWGGVYKNYLRLLLPLEASSIVAQTSNLENINLDTINDDQKKIKTIGFFLEVQPLKMTTIYLTFDKPLPTNVTVKNLRYLIEIQKQSGIVSYPHTLLFAQQDKKVDTEIKTARIINLHLGGASQTAPRNN